MPFIHPTAHLPSPFVGAKFVKLEILSTSFIDFLCDKLGELELRSLDLNGSLGPTVIGSRAHGNWFLLSWSPGQVFFFFFHHCPSIIVTSSGKV